ncbi:MAG: patatin-like phospholipase family protein [Rhodospirillales bacterium]|jgi:NTE family protein|nr:patatin-like phospholipase family protein [Rhodospirillales bacterium]
MDLESAGAETNADTAAPGRASRRPPGCNQVALVLQGGGALGAYQAGVYQALHEAGIEPDFVAGVSIGAINGAIIAGNPPERRLERLRAFWETITARPAGTWSWPFPVDGDEPRRAVNTLAAMQAMAFGQPGFFTPNLPNPWFSPRGAKTATSIYDTAPLRETLLRLVDFDLLNRNPVRYAAGAVAIRSGNFRYFDTTQSVLGPEHVMASGALPPALPMVRIGEDCYWDGGLVSNTPLQHVMENAGSARMLLFQVDLFSSRGRLPRDMMDVLSREKDIRYSSRTRMVTDAYKERFRERRMLRSLLAKVPEDRLTPEEKALKESCDAMPELTILHLIFEQAAYEGQAKDYEFSAASMREHWQSGYRDTSATLGRKSWIRVGTSPTGIVVHDVHRLEEG